MTGTRPAAAWPTLVVVSRAGRGSLPASAWERLDAAADVRLVRRDTAPAPDEAVAMLRDADYLGATNVCLPLLDAALLDALPRLRGVVLYATGYDHLDVPMLRRRGIGLSVLPDYATTAVAEHAVALLLALATRLHLANDRSRGAVGPGTSLRGLELSGRTLGVVGVGRIGTRVAALARGLGMRVLGTDIDHAAAARAAAAGVEVTNLDGLLRRCDAVALTASHRRGRPPVLGPEAVAALRPGALLVNVGRPALVDTPSVLASLRSGRLRGYAVDDVVLDPLDGPADERLLTEGRLLQTGHSAWWRDEVLERGARMWGDALLAAVTDRPLDAVTWPAAVVPRQVRPSPRLVPA